MKFVIQSIFKTLIVPALIFAYLYNAQAQTGTTATILPPAETTFVDLNGNPLNGGKVFFYLPTTTTFKTTWQDAAETIPNTNPVILDAAGRAVIYGFGTYRQQVFDRNNNLQWDKLTSSPGSGSGGSTATGDGDLVGTIKPWAGMIAPNQYVFAYGQELSRALFPALFTAITSTQSVFCNSGSPILNGLSDTTNFWIGMTVELSCLGAGNSTVISKTSTTVTIAANANVTLNTNATFFPWGRGNGTTTFNLPDLRGYVLAGNDNMGGTIAGVLTTANFGSQTPDASGAAGGSQTVAVTLTVSNLPPYTPAGTTTSTQNVLKSGGGLVQVGNGAPANLGLTYVAPTDGALTSNINGTPQGGTDTPFNVNKIQPTRMTNFIIKVTPDSNSSTASGVTSLGLMTGDIACGTGLLCTGNTISTNIGSLTSPPYSVNILNAPYNAKCDSVTDDTTAIANAIAATPAGGLLLLPPSTCLIRGSGSAIFTITNPINIVGTGSSASGGGSALLVASGVPTTRDIFHIVGVTNSTLRGYSFKNFSIVPVSGAVGQHGLHFDTTAGTTTNLAEITIENLVIVATATAGGNSIFFDNGIGTNTNGGSFHIAINGGFYGGGISSAQMGDSISIENALISTANAGIIINQVAGAGSFGADYNNISGAGGCFIIQSSISFNIKKNNECEQQVTNTEANNSVIDITGSSGNVSSGKIEAQINVLASVGNPTPIRIANATGVVVDNARLSTPAAYAHIINTAAASGTVIGAGNLFTGGGANITDTGSGTIFSPQSVGTITSLIGNPTGSVATPIDIPIGSSLAISAGSLILNTAHANQWTNTQQFIANALTIDGATSGTLTLNCAAVCGSNTLTFPAGTTDFSATGGTSRVVKQTTLGGALTVAQLANTDITGLGTASTQNTGTSGANVPLLNGANTWGAVQTFTNGTSSAPSITGATAATGLYFATTLAGLASSGGGIFTVDSNNYNMLAANNSGPTLNLKPVSGGGATAVSGVNLYNFGAGASNQNIMFSFNARGTVASPTAVQSGDPLFLFGVAGHDGTNAAGTLGFDGGISFAAAGTFTTTSHPTSAILYVTPSGTKVAVAALTVNNDSSAVWGSTNSATSYISKGTVPTGTTGSCSASTFVGGPTAGKFTAPACAAGTIILSALPTSTNGYTCNAQDQTTPTTGLLQQTANTTSSVTFKATTTNLDIIVFSCMGW